MLYLLFAIMSITQPGVPARPSTGKLVVVNQFEHSVSVIDLADDRILGTVSVGVNGHEVAVSRDGRYAYVPIYSNVAVGQSGTNGQAVDVIDLQSVEVERTIDLGKPVRPHCAGVGADGLLYVTAELDSALYAVDPAKGEVVARIPSGQQETHMFVLSKDGHRAYTANISDGSVSVLDLQKHKLVTVIHVANTVQRISISPDGRDVFTHDQHEPRIAVIDTRTNEISHWISVPSVVFASAPTPDGNWLLALSPSAGRLYKISLRTGELSQTVELPSGPMEAVVTRDGAWAFVSCIGAGEVVVLNLKTGETAPPIKLHRGVDGMAIALR